MDTDEYVAHFCLSPKPFSSWRNLDVSQRLRRWGSLSPAPRPSCFCSWNLYIKPLFATVSTVYILLFIVHSTPSSQISLSEKDPSTFVSPGSKALKHFFPPRVSRSRISRVDHVYLFISAYEQGHENPFNIFIFVLTDTGVRVDLFSQVLSYRQKTNHQTRWRRQERLSQQSA